jgi:hypothetical protein
MSIKNVFENVLDQTEIEEILVQLSKEKGIIEDNHYYNGSIGFYNLPVANQHLDKVEKLVKPIIEYDIKFENSFTRIYKKDSILGFHIDRPGLDVTVSLCLKRDTAWPLIVSNKPADENYSEQNQESYRLDSTSYDILPGSIVVAEGRKYPHWREEFPGNDDQNNVYVFFHWNRV